MLFTKMHALKNDYILFDFIKNPKYQNEINTKFIQSICNRTTGVGSDGVLLVLKDKESLLFRMFNPDGTEAEACANGLRCYAQYVYDNNYTNQKTSFKIKLFMTQEFVDLKVKEKLVSLELSHIKYNKKSKIIIQEKEYPVFYFSVPNPHAVVFVDEKILTTQNIFKTINFEYSAYNLNIANKNNNIINLRTHERGAGETLSCGTGASATAVANYILHKTPNVKIKMSGGNASLTISQLSNKLYKVLISSDVHYVESSKTII